MADQDLSNDLAGQGYQLVGRHSAVKLCYWSRESIARGRDCYKGRFYGIESHRCLQMSPAIDSCNLHCRFCWRNQGWENDEGMPEFDDPETLLDRSIEAQRRIISGFRASLAPRNRGFVSTSMRPLIPTSSQRVSTIGFAMYRSWV